ncbi:MAG TPA: ROK family glucokinase [Clostridia bacterium]|jgi:glucokinase|nr:ROK family glucokinase [Clostridia bacterium]
MYYLGIDVGGMSIKGALIDEKGVIYYRDNIKTEAAKDSIEILEDIKNLCINLIQGGGINTEEIAGIGIGIPGSIDAEKGVIVYSNNINFENIKIVNYLRQTFDCPIKIGNDANVAALGEMKFGSGKGAKNLILVTLGTGVGTGIIVESKILLGKFGAGGEGGHMTLIYNGLPCTCGKKGCWECYASATALIRITEEYAAKYPDSEVAKNIKHDGKASGKTAFLAARKGDKTGAKIVSKYVKYVSEGLISLVNIFRPDCILIGGGVSNEGEYLMKKIERRVSRYSYGGDRNYKVPVRKAELQNDAGILGAAALCMDS